MDIFYGPGKINWKPIQFPDDEIVAP